MRALGEDVARDKDVGPAEIDAEIDHEEVAEEHVEYHRGAVGVPGEGRGRGWGLGSGLGWGLGSGLGRIVKLWACQL